VPFLRVVRDKRGYETTYLIHSIRQGSRQESRVLYAFRTPGGVRVGRDPFDPLVRREIESGNPGIAFDWDALLSGRQVIDTTPDVRRPRRKPTGSREPQGRPEPGRASGPDEGVPQPPAARRPDHPAQTPRLAVPVAIEGDTPETRMRFLAHWHGILCEQLPQRVVDPERRASLMTVVQRLNPAGWIDADEISAGLAQATEALERLSRLLSKRRRKARRSGPREERAESGPSGDSTSDEPAPE